MRLDLAKPIGQRPPLSLDLLLTDFHLIEGFQSGLEQQQSALIGDLILANQRQPPPSGLSAERFGSGFFQSNKTLSFTEGREGGLLEPTQ